jgi:hypothetical protein
MGFFDGIFGKDEIKQLQKQLHEKDHEITQLGTKLAALKNSQVSLEEKFLVKERLASEGNSYLDRLKSSLHLQQQETERLTSELALLKRSSSEQQERDIDSILNLQDAVVEAKSFAEKATKERDAQLQELQSIRDVHEQKERKFFEREASLSAISESLFQEKQIFLEQEAVFRDRISHLEQQLHVQEVETKRRNSTDQALLQREKDIQEWNTLLTSKEQQIEVQKSDLSRIEADLSSRSDKLEAWARDLRSFQTRVAQLDDESAEIEAKAKKLQAKIDAHQTQHAERLSALRQQRYTLQRETDKITQLDVVLKDRAKDLRHEESKIVDIKNQNFALKLDKEALKEQVKLIEKTNEELQTSLAVLYKEYSNLEENYQIALSGNVTEKNNALVHPTVLAWLLQNGDPETAKIDNGWLGSTGHGPWEEDSLIQCLDDLGYLFYPLSDDELEFIIVGRVGWSASDLRNLIAAREGQPLRIYSQEMFFAKLATGRDPFDAGDSDLLEAFAEDHPALQFLMALPDAWPDICQANDSHVMVVPPGSYGGVTQSPLNILEYHVGVTSKQSTTVRRSILAKCFEMKQLPFSEDSDSAYVQQWGRSNSAQRLYRIALHLKILAESQGKDPRKLQAGLDWMSDSVWLKEMYFSKFKKIFTWPSI